MPKFAICNSTKGYWDVHKAGCADVAKNIKNRQYNGQPWIVEAPDARTAAINDCDAELQEMGYTPDDYKIFPCCKDAQ
jgi:hypothetical protein